MFCLLYKRWFLVYTISAPVVFLIINFILKYNIENLFKTCRLVYSSFTTNTLNSIALNFWFTHVLFIYLIILILLSFFAK